MVIAVLSLTALVIVIVLGIVKPNINIGVIAIAFAYAIGIFVLGLKEKDIPLLFPANLFLMLVGITLIFGIAYENGTLQIFTNKIVGLVKSKPQFLPIIFFFITLLISALGPGNIAATALIAPIAIATALKAKISPLLMAIMVCTGANAGAFSPISPTGIIGIGLMDKIGVNSKDLSGVVFLASALIQSVSAALAYFVFKGFMNKHIGEIEVDEGENKKIRLNRNQILTIIAIVSLIVSLSLFKAPISLASFVIASILFVITKTEDTIKNVPWDAILLVCGVSVLIGILEKAGGLDLATTAISKVSTSNTVNTVLAFVTGVISAYSSSSGVVLPAFIPLIPGLIVKLGGGDITRMIIAVSVGSHMVDVSPLSTLGAICIACIPAIDRQSIFRKLLIWGLLMAVFGAILSFIFLDIHILG